MKTLKVLLQEVVSGIKAWVNSNFAQESNTVHKTGDETITGNKTFSGRNTFSDHTYIYGQWRGLYFKNPEATAGVAPSGDKRNYISFTDSNDYTLGSIVLNVTGANSTWFQIGVLAKDVNDSSNSIYCGTQYRVYGDGGKYFNPSTNGDVYLGTSTLQWKSVYAQSYYYNGTAWGLDKANFWTNTNKFYGITIAGHSGIRWLRDGYTAGTLPETRMYYGFQNSYDSNEDVFDRIRSYISTTGTNMREHYKYAWDDLSKYIHKGFWISNDGSDSEQSFLVNRVIPETDGATDLGTTTNRWKTFNGVNPGALSFPEGTTNNANTTFNPDLTDWLTDGTAFTITAQVTGWLHIRIQNSTGNFAWVKRASAGDNQTWCIVGNSDTNSTVVDIPLNVPVVQGYTYTIKIKSSRVSAAIFMCLGNV